MSAEIRELADQLEASQWLERREIVRRQHERLAALARHAASHARWFRERLDRAGLAPDDLASPSGLARMPVLCRGDLQSLGEDLFVADVPPGHGGVVEVRTSGSTGEPVVVRRTARARLFWQAMNLREHRWHARDPLLPVSAIRARIGRPFERDGWGEPWNQLFPTGRFQGIPITMSAAEHAALLDGFAPHTLIVYPSALAALGEHLLARGRGLPSVRVVRTLGETVSLHLRDLTRRIFQVEIQDHYSSQEVGSIAIQCPESGLYHLQSEALLVEILNHDGAPAAVGEVGRVVLTDLHNHATPLVRYEIGDHAEVGAECGCGRGLPTLARILGRERNLILMPDGTRHWPLIGAARLRDIAPVRQFRLTQHDRARIEVELVCERRLSIDEESALKAEIQTSLGHAFALELCYHEREIPRGPGGKFEEFVSKI